MIIIQPDIEFKQQLKKVSNSSLNECMQCGNCSVVCTLAPENNPFPRKEMIWAGWGMKDSLIHNTDIWLCHQCGDCSTHCPRDVKPADVFAAVRQITYKQYAKPKFFGEMLNKPKFLPLAILIPVLIISGILMLAGTFQIPEGDVNYSKFFPHIWLNSSFTMITLLSVGLGVLSLKQFWNDLKNKYPDSKTRYGFFKSLLKIKNQIILHSNFNSCTSQKSRKIAHLLVFYGFILLLIVTAFAIYAAVTHNYPLKITNPFKILGNIAGLMILVGLSMMVTNRIFNKKEFGNSTYTDWLFLVSFYLLTISGILVQFARFLNWSSAYHLYFFHLVCVWFIIIYIPYTKFGHLLYRTVAMAFANSIGRNLKKL